MIHPTAIVHPKAKVPSSTQIGPYAVIDENVELGADCMVGPHVYLTGITTIGVRNRFHAGCVIGDAPQDLKYSDEATRLRIGDNNVFREHVTVHRSNKAAEDTVIGSHGFFMAHCHVAHNCLVGDHVILANGALLAGHVTVQDRVFISGNCVIHQFIRVGTLALMQGGSALSQDLPPFTIVHGLNQLCGLNVIGLRRAGISSAERLELKQVYRALFRSGENLRAALAKTKEKFTGGPAKALLDFVSEAKRGVCFDSSRRPAASGDDPSGM
jgi:UDP-N-acetylglucosamine acyltransferase